MTNQHIAQILDREATRQWLADTVKHASLELGFFRSVWLAGVEVDGDMRAAVGSVLETLKDEAIPALVSGAVTEDQRCFNCAYARALEPSESGLWPVAIDEARREIEGQSGPVTRARACGTLAAAVALKQRCELFVRDTLHPEE